MGCSVYTVTIDCADPAALARFWAEVLDYEVTFEEDDEVVIEPKGGPGNALLFGKVADEKVVKNRIHLDLNPSDQAAEVERVKGVGATEVDIGQSDVPWVVLADPEGNEFCILTAR
ncbi:MAG TPA: VOC family protein [Actinomycetota bacterium]|nr:VOC family protein [Actinomycetota bacterium]